MQQRQIKYLVFHESENPAILHYSAKYHLVIDPLGVVHKLHEFSHILHAINGLEYGVHVITNDICIHVCLLVEKEHRNPFKYFDKRTPDQYVREFLVARQIIDQYPTIQCLGHNQIEREFCPKHDVVHLLFSLGIPLVNLYNTDHFGLLDAMPIYEP